MVTDPSVDSETEKNDDCPPESCEELDCDAATICEDNHVVLYVPYCVCGECKAPKEGVIIEECLFGCDEAVDGFCLPEEFGVYIHTYTNSEKQWI